MIPKEQVKGAIEWLESVNTCIGMRGKFIAYESSLKQFKTALSILKAYDEGTIGEKSQEIVYQKGTIFVGTCPKCKSEVIGNRIRVKLKPLKSQKEDK